MIIKVRAFLVLIFILLIVSTFFSFDELVKAQASNENDNVEKKLNENIDNQLNHLDFNSIEELLAEVSGGDLFDNNFMDKVKSILNGDFKVNTGTFFEAIIKLIMSELFTFLPLLATIAAIAILSNLVTNFKSKTLSNSTSEIVFYACYALVILLVISNVHNMYELTKRTIDGIRKFSEAVMPVLLTLMVAANGRVSAKVYQPAVALMSSGVTEMIDNIILPIFLISLIFAVISNISKNVRLSKLADFFRSASSWILGIVFMVFSAFMSVKGITAGAMDGISFRAAKFATRSYIPILGGYLSEGLDLFLTGSVLIKNAVGVAGLALLLALVFVPVIKLIVFGLGIKLTASIIEPMTDSRMSSFLITVSKNMSILYVSIIAVTFMLFIMIMLIILTSNAMIG
ncbi:MAG: stage III sporulation protein AE [Clostridia bacterium]